MLLKSLLESFTNHSERNAFCINDTYYTYKEFAHKINSIYQVIISGQHKKHINIGIITTDTIETYASIFACWFSHNAYVPLNPQIPIERNNAIVEQAQISIILTSENENSGIVKSTDNVTFINTTEIVHTKDFFENYQELTPGTLLYILFTSGSTGVPKGVPINCENIESFLQAYNHLGFEHSLNDRFLQMFELTFDVSVASYLIPLLAGACIYTVPQGGIKYMNVYKLIKKNNVTVAFVVPSILNYLKPFFNDIHLPELKYCILTAEASNVNIAIEWAKCMPNGKIINLYGPTEATIWCTSHFFSVDEKKSYNDMMVIGKPFKNVDALILDESGVEAANGTKGELHISTKQLTNGYLNNKEKNEEVFVIKDDKRFYKTGDLCYIDDQGDIFYCGRIDHQIKIQGFRIELSEIEVTVRNFFEINNVAVSYKNKMGVDSICLFLETTKNVAEEVKNTLAQNLPYYMQPSQIRMLQTLPCNTSNKIDRVKLSQIAND